MAFEYDGKIYLNLEEQVEVNSRMAVDAKETAEAAEALVDSKADKTYVDTELAKKVNNLTTDSGVKAYTFNSSGNYSLAVVDTATTAGTIVRRTSGGNIMCAPPSNNAHAATKAYVDNNFVAKQTTTSTAKRAYVYDNNGDTNVVISADNANGNTLVMRTNAGRIACADPNAAGQAATKGYVDNGFIAKSASTGVVYTNDTNGNPSTIAYTNSATGSTIVTRTSGGQVKCAAPVDGEAFHNDAAINRSYADDRYTQKAGISSSRKIPYFSTTEDGSYFTSTGGNGNTEPTTGGVVPITTSGKISVGTPTGPYHAANKKYVDDNFFQKAVVTPSLSTYQDINGYTWQGLYTAMQNAEAAPIYLNNTDRWLYFGTNQADTICNQVVTFAFDEILGNKFFFVLKYVKEQAGTQTIQEIQCSITSTGVISAAII